MVESTDPTGQPGACAAPKRDGSWMGAEEVGFAAGHPPRRPSLDPDDRCRLPTATAVGSPHGRYVAGRRSGAGV